MLLTRPALVSGLAAVLTFAACQSVRTQGVPMVESTPVTEPSAVVPAVPETTETVAVVAPAPAFTPKHSYNSVNVDGPYIALTFDDGPHPVHTPRLLDILKQNGVRATFYVIGRSVETYPEIARRIVAEGHEIANHTWSHPALSKLGSASVESQIRKTNEVIHRVTGVTPTNMRPPYGATNARLNKRLDEEFGLKVIMWSVDPLDWKYRNAARVTQQILDNTQAGGIVLAHDIHASTVDAMPATIAGLKARGFQFVTVDELLKMERGAPAPTDSAAANQSASPATPAPTPFVVTRTDKDE